jgi:hypothetical protein
VSGEVDKPDAQALELIGRQLDRYQAVIARLAGNQLQVKTWCVTALAALAAVAVNGSERGVAALGVVVLITFLILDAYYLSLERHFRDESEKVADKTVCDWRAAFSIEAPPRERRASWQALRRCGASLALSPFYLGLLVIVVLGFVLAG